MTEFKQNESDKKYQIIYADPPWSYKDTMGGYRLSANAHYETQTLDWIKNLPIKQIADKNCVLFLWATNPLLPEAFEVIKAWGFTYKTVAFSWSKTSNKGNLVYNLGGWTMGNVESVLLATKGKPKRIRKDIKQLVIATRKRHSQKPDAIRNLIVDLMGDKPRVELFARHETDNPKRFKGWDVFGNEVSNSIAMPASEKSQSS